MSAVPARRTLPGPQVTNVTPLELRVRFLQKDAAGLRKEIGAAPLKPFMSATCDPLGADDVIEVVPQDIVTKKDFRSLELHLTDPPLILTASRLHWLPGQLPEYHLTFKNATRVHVNIFYVNYKGNGEREERLYSGNLAPGSSLDVRGFSSRLWIVKSVFSGELLVMFLNAEGGTQTVTVTSDFCEQKLEHKDICLPSPVPEIPALFLVGSGSAGAGVQREFAKVDPRSRDYILISQFDNLTQKQFNTRQNVGTRSLRISGVYLSSEEYPLNAYRGQSGEAIVDLASLELYADTIIVSSLLRLPGVNVTIHARELEFRAGGKIDTTPIEFKTPAATPPQKRDSEGRPKDYIAANGLPGEKGGDISILVNKLTIPPQEAQEIRFVSRGSRGQAGENGGLKPYKPGNDQQPKEGVTKSIPFVTVDMMTRAFGGHFVGDGQNLNYWRWPGSTDDDCWQPQYIRWEGTQLFYEDGSKGCVTSLKIIACDDNITSQDTNFIFLPNQKIETVSVFFGTLPFGYEFKHNKIKAFRVTAPDGPTSPGRGEDAYSGGKPGDSGQGGKIASSLPLKLIEQICDTRGGDAPPTTSKVDGGSPGGPNPAYSVEMVIVKYGGIQSRRKPQIRVTPLDVKAGTSAEALEKPAGLKGCVIHDDSRTWMHPDVVDAVLACAKDAYRNEDRDLAARLLEPYYGLLRDTKDLELKSRFAAIEALRGKLLSNVDFYGNPPGWVPRLNLVSTFQVFKDVQSISSSVLYYALNMADKYDTLENANALASRTSDAVSREMELTVGRLKAAFTDLAKARQSLYEVRDEVGLKQKEIDTLKSWATDLAQHKREEQRIFRGVMKTIGGLMKAVPVGQPYLGLAGDITAGIGDFNWNDPDGITKQIGNSIEKIGVTTDAFLKDNRDLIIKNSVPSALRDRLELEKAADSTLEYELDKAKSEIDKQELAVTRQQQQKETEWKSKKKDELEKLKTQLKTTLEEIEKDQTRDSLELLSKEKREKKLADIRTLKERSDRAAATELRTRKNGLEEAIKGIEKEEEKAKEQHDETALAQLNKEKEKLAALKQKYIEQDIGRKTEARSVKLSAAEIEKREKQAGATLDRLKGLGSGISAIGQGISSFATLKQDDPEVKSLASLLLESEKKEEFSKLLREFSALAEKQNIAFVQLQSAQLKIDTHVANITQNLSELNALSRQRQSLDAALDIRLRRYLKDMQNRAVDALQWSIYALVMAYRYEYLEDVKGDFLNLDKIVERLRALDGTVASSDSPLKAWKADYDRFKQPEEKVLQNEFLGMVMPIIQRRQSIASVRQNSWVCSLPPELCGELRLKGEVTFNLVRDLKCGSFSDTSARIVDIADLKLALSTQRKTLSLKAVFWHSGESIIRSPVSPHRYYYFRAGLDDDPINWGFNYTHVNGKPVITKDSLAENNDEFLKLLLANAGGGSAASAKSSYVEYLPSYFSDITLVLRRGSVPWNPQDIDEIQEVGFTVLYAFSTPGR